MKTRNGFVSNSSTSSFVLVGVDISHLAPKENNKVFYEFCHQIREKYENKFGVLYGSEQGLGDYQVVIGKMIADIYSDDNCLESEIIDIQKVVDDVKELDLAKDLPVRIFMGTRMS
jgi:hypothetical protein